MVRRSVAVRSDDDKAMDVAVALLVAVLNAEVIPSVPCDIRGCKLAGAVYRNGAWCEHHAATMERHVVRLPPVGGTGQGGRSAGLAWGA